MEAMERVKEPDSIKKIISRYTGWDENSIKAGKLDECIKDFMAEKLEDILTDMMIECVDMHPKIAKRVIDKYKERILSDE